MTTDLEDDEIARLMALSDEEILAEARAEGIDTDKLAYEMAEQFKVIAKLVREREKARELLGRAWTRNAQWSRELHAVRGALGASDDSDLASLATTIVAWVGQLETTLWKAREALNTHATNHPLVDEIDALLEVDDGD